MVGFDYVELFGSATIKLVTKLLSLSLSSVMLRTLNCYATALRTVSMHLNPLPLVLFAPNLAVKALALIFPLNGVGCPLRHGSSAHAGGCNESFCSGRLALLSVQLKRINPAGKLRLA